VFPQQSQVFTHSDITFLKGKELFNQGKYAASYSYFVDCLKKTDPAQAGLQEETEYYLAANAYELKQQNAANLLKDFIYKYPLTVFADEVNSRLGRMEVDNKNFHQAMLFFNKANTAHLGQNSQTECLFAKGYASIQTKNYAAASVIFKNLKEQETHYRYSSQYYFAYSEYCLKNYDSALPDFLKLETNPSYKNIVPYYIVQILYAQKK